MTDRIGVGKSTPSTNFYLAADRISQSVNGNYTTVRMYLRCDNTGTTGSYSGGYGAQIGIVDGAGEFGRHEGNPFLPSGYANGQRWNDGPWDVTIGHNSDGSRGSVTLRMQLRYSGVNEDYTADFNDFPTIPRASSISAYSPSQDDVSPDHATTLTINRASTSFTHDLFYSFGAIQDQQFASGVATSYAWTPPASLYNQIPNATTAVDVIKVNTYNSGTYIGQTSNLYRLNVPSSIVPTWSSVANSQPTDNNAITAIIGSAYLQGFSKIAYAISSAAGVYSSTITEQKFQIDGQTLLGASGTSAVLQSAGTLSGTFTVTDSRGRVKTQTNSITVLPYSPPQITAFQARRALSDGTLDATNGTNIRVDLASVVQSIVNSTQRNSFQIKVYTRPVGTSTWTLKSTLSPSGLTYNTFTTVAGPFPLDTSYEVRVDVIDRFSSVTQAATLGVADITMHWANNSGSAGVGIGKYWQQGRLDVAGDIYTSGLVYGSANFGGGVANQALALLDPAYYGPGPAKVSFFTAAGTLGSLSATAYTWLGQARRNGNPVVEMTNLNGTWYILGHSGREQYGGKIRLPVGIGMTTYNRQLVVNSWSEPRATRVHTGIVVLGGMLAFSTAASNGMVLATLPVGYRPSVDSLFQVTNSSNPRVVRIVASSGEIQVYGTNWIVGTNDWVSLDGIAYPAAGAVTWTNITTFLNSWTAYDTANFGTPGYWKDPYGVVWFRGAVGGGTTAADDTAFFQMPAGYQQHLQSHVATASSSGGTGGSGFGFISAFPSSASPAGKVAWKNGSVGNTYVSLARLTIITAEAMSTLDWSRAGLFSNSWENFSGSYPSLGVTIRPDGFAMAQGLIEAGTMGQKASNVGPYSFPEKTALFPVASNAAFGRVDVGGDQGAVDNSGIIVPQAGSNGWVSLDGMKWMVE